MSEWSSFISNVGFPIACCVGLALALWYMWKQILSTCNKLTETNSELVKTNSNLVASINNKIDGIDKKLDMVIKK